MDDHAVAATLAREAGSLLVDIRAGGGSEGDRRSNELLLRRLAELRPDDAVLSEETVDDPIRLKHDRVWIIDPLDGTREYGEPPRDDWAVHVALTLDGKPAAGAVALPAADLHVSRLDGSPLRYNQPDPYLPDLLICRPELARLVFDALR